MLKRTPFYELHKSLDAKLINFGGWEMPVQYQSIRKEHHAVRKGVGIFDVSHMGEFVVSGPEALKLIQHLTINDASKLVPGKAQYSAMCYKDGGIVDDLLVYKLGEGDSYMLVVNASNITKDFEWIQQNNSFDAKVIDQSPDTCLLAVQGPESVRTLQKLTDEDLNKIKFYTFEKGDFAGFENVLISATGYTGEKGFELYFNRQKTDPENIWEAIMEAGAEFDIQPCGLGARDTLRLEMGFALYGNDLNKHTNPLEARLGWLTKLEKGDFIGREALLKAKEEGIDRQLVGFTLEDPRSIPRMGYTILDSQSNEIGEVTSGAPSVTLGKNIGMGYVKSQFAKEGSTIIVRIRKKEAEAVVTKPPFIKKN
jgi:aminomethyltransferase